MTEKEDTQLAEELAELTRWGGKPSSLAAAWAAAAETASSALAPRRLLFVVPSNSIRIRSTSA